MDFQFFNGHPVFGLILKPFTLTVLISFFPKIFLHHVADKKVRVLLFSKNCKNSNVKIVNCYSFFNEVITICSTILTQFFI